MSIAKTTQLANRYGLNIKLWAAGTTSFVGDLVKPLMVIEFVNLTNISISGDKTWATGGRAHRQKIGFDNPLTGTLKLSSQILTAELLALMAGKDLSTFTGTSIDFETGENTSVLSYVIQADTVWKDSTGALYSEALTAYCATPKRALNIEHNGDGDPVSVDIEFDLIENDNGKILTVGLTDYAKI